MTNRPHRFIHGAGRSLTDCEPCMAGERKYRQLQTHDPNTGETPTITCLGCPDSVAIPETLDLTMSGWSWTAPASNTSTDASIDLNTGGNIFQPGQWYDCEVTHEFRSHNIGAMNGTGEMVRTNTLRDYLAGLSNCHWTWFDLKSTTVQYHRGTGTTCDPDYTEISTQAVTDFNLDSSAVNTGTASGCGLPFQADYNWYEADFHYGFYAQLTVVPATESPTGVWAHDADGTPHWRLQAVWQVGRWHKAVANGTASPTSDTEGRATFAGGGGPYDRTDTTNGPGSTPPFRYTPDSRSFGDFVQFSSLVEYWREVDCDDITDPSFDLTLQGDTDTTNNLSQWGVTAPNTITLAVTS